MTSTSPLPHSNLPTIWWIYSLSPYIHMSLTWTTPETPWVMRLVLPWLCDIHISNSQIYELNFATTRGKTSSLHLSIGYTIYILSKQNMIHGICVLSPTTIYFLFFWMNLPLLYNECDGIDSDEHRIKLRCYTNQHTTIFRWDMKSISPPNFVATFWRSMGYIPLLTTFARARSNSYANTK